MTERAGEREPIAVEMGGGWEGPVRFRRDLTIGQLLGREPMQGTIARGPEVGAVDPGAV